MNFESLYLWQKYRLMAKQKEPDPRYELGFSNFIVYTLTYHTLRALWNKTMWFDQMLAVMRRGWCPSKDNSFGSWGFGNRFKLHSISCFNALLNKDIMYYSELIWIFLTQFSPLIKYHKVSNKDITESLEKKIEAKNYPVPATLI